MATRKKIVSIVDNEIDITELFQYAISASIHGVSVITFNDSVIALEHFTDNKKNYALVISDLRMPNLNGLELLKKVKQLNPSVRTILVSAYELDDDQVFQNYMKQGIINLIVKKPIGLPELCQEVANQVQDYQLSVKKQ
ncbi:MAG TPA: response regulator [Nitrososphaeraceae archaeon]